MYLAQEVSTKYSAWPKCLLRSDLSLLEPHRQSGQYQSEASRFHNSEKHTLGQDHKQIRYKIYENKLRRMAGWNEAILQQI